MDRKTKKQLEHIVSAGFGLPLQKLAECLPIGVSCFIFGMLGKLACAVIGKQRRAAVSNLEIVYGRDAAPERLYKMASESFANMGRSLCEVFAFYRLRPERLREVVRLEGEKNLADAAAKGRGVIVFSAHMGNFWIIGPRLALEGYRFNYIIKFPGGGVFPGVLSRLARHYGVGLISVKPRMVSLRQSMRKLAAGEIICILGDQRYKKGVKISFFGAPALAPPGPAALALRTGAGIVPVFAYRDRDGFNRIVIEPEFKLEVSGGEGEDILTNTGRLAKVVESHILKNPEDWWWVHRRWKVEPGGAN